MISSILLPCGRRFLIDAADLGLLAGRRWHADQRPHTCYVRGRLPGQRGSGVYLHGLLIGSRADHRDGDGLNNSRSNLRPCTQAQNGINRSAKSGKTFKGIYPRGRKFYAQLYAGKRAFSSFGHATPESAALAYDALARTHHGEFARLNFPADRADDARQSKMFEG